MATKKVKIKVYKSLKKGSLSVDAWDEDVSIGSSDEIEWTLDRWFKITFKTPGHFPAHPDFITGNASTPAITGPVDPKAPPGLYFYTIETIGPFGSLVTVDPGYRVWP